jgi:sugar lactone lactonase YvrE
MRSIYTLLLLIVATSLPGQASSVRDSAGIRIVMNPALTTAKELFVLQREPSYRVGGLEDDPGKELKSNQGYLRGVFLSDGTLAVTDEWRLQFFDRQAKRLAIVGTKGAGPGDFSYIIGICRTRGDTIVVHDSHNARNVVVAPNRKVVSSFPAKPDGKLTMSSCFDDGTVVLSTSEYDRATGTSSMRYVRARLDGTVTNPLVKPPAARFDLVTATGEGVATAGQRFYYTAPGSSEITAYNTAGRPVLIIRHATVPEKIADAEALGRMPYVLPRDGSKPSEAYIAEARAEAFKSWKARPHPEHWPTHGQIHVDDSGQLWVKQYVKTRDAPNVWVAFSADGRMVGKVVLPSGRVEVIAFGKDSVLMRTYDDDGATYLVSHAITRK